MQKPLATLRVLYASRDSRLLLVRYIAIGGFVFFLEVAAFWVFLFAHSPLLVATSLSFLIATSTHFTLNRSFNFRNFDRPALHQIRTYAVVAGFTLLVQNVVVSSSVGMIGLAPIYAKMLGILVALPLGYFGHRYLTFGPGIDAAIRSRFRPNSNR